MMGIVVIMCCLLLLKGLCGQVYKKRIIDAVEIACYVNVTLFSAAQLYILQSGKHHTITAFLSVSVTVFILLVVVSYHIYTELLLKLLKKFQLAAGTSTNFKDHISQEYHGSRSFTSSVIDGPSSMDGLASFIHVSGLSENSEQNDRSLNPQLTEDDNITVTSEATALANSSTHLP